MAVESGLSPLIELRNLTKTYLLGDVEVPVLKGISMKIHEGTLLALMGPSGGGKSTLMNILGFLDTLSGGQYLLDGKDVSTLSSNARADLRNERIGFVFQNFNLLARTSALKNVMMPLEYARHAQSAKAQRAWAEHLLERVGLEVPQATRLLYELKKEGFSLPDGCVRADACAEALYASLGGDGVGNTEA